MIRPDELVLTFEEENEPGSVQDMIVDIDMSVLRFPLHIGHTLYMCGREAVITSIVHWLPEEPGQITEMVVRAKVDGALTEEHLATHVEGTLGLSNPRVG